MNFGGLRLLSLETRRAPPCKTSFQEALRGLTVVVRGPKPSAVMREWKVPIAVAAPEPNTRHELLAPCAFGRAARAVLWPSRYQQDDSSKSLLRDVSACEQAFTGSLRCRASCDSCGELDIHLNHPVDQARRRRRSSDGSPARESLRGRLTSSSIFPRMANGLLCLSPTDPQ